MEIPSGGVKYDLLGEFHLTWVKWNAPESKPLQVWRKVL